MIPAEWAAQRIGRGGYRVALQRTFEPTLTRRVTAEGCGGQRRAVIGRLPGNDQAALARTQGSMILQRELHAGFNGFGATGGHVNSGQLRRQPVGL